MAASSHVRVALLHNARRRTSRWHSHLVDIDDHKRPQQVLETSQGSLQRIVDTDSKMICVAPSVRALKAGVIDFLTKTFCSRALREAVNTGVLQDECNRRIRR